MIKYLLSLLFAVQSLSFAVPTEIPEQASLASIYDSLTHPILDDQEAFSISGCTLERGGQSITLLHGTIRFFASVQGKRFGVIFSGKGIYTIAPPTQIERSEYERQTGITLDSGRHQYEFQRAVLWFADSVCEQLYRHSTPVQIDVQRNERDGVERSVQYATDPSNENALYRILQEMFEEHPEPYLLAHLILDREGTDLFLEYDMRRYEEVVIARPFFNASTGYNFTRDPLCSFHIPVEYVDANEFDLCQEDKRRVDVLNDSVECTMENRSKLQYRAVIHCRPAVYTPASILFALNPTFDNLAIRSAKGAQLPFLRRPDRKGWEILVFLPRQDSSGYYLQFTYDCEVRTYGKSFNYIPPHGWYPSIGSYDRALFDMAYRYPSDYRVVSAGTKLFDTTINGRSESRYATRDPALGVSFRIGKFEEKIFPSNPDEPAIKLYGDNLDAAAPIGYDLVNSVHLFTSLFGKVASPELKVTTGFLGNGESFPQFIYLPFTKEIVGDNLNAVGMGGAHEAAHTWWGEDVGWRSYHDQWLAEGFAHYSTLLHALYMLKSEKPVYDKLREWREQIVGARKFLLGSGPASGSIWLGYRSSSYKTPDDPTLLIYMKGAWVLHMLRMLMMDIETFKEDSFRAMMHEYYGSFKGLDPGTQDFEHIVEKYMRADMSWFFHEWVYGAEIPVYKVQHTIAKNDTGKWVVNVQVTQSGVSGSFKMYVPIEITLKGGQSAFGRMLINQPANEFHYEFDSEPEKIIVNPFESVLCTVEQ